jgi:hypothetical protein
MGRKAGAIVATAAGLGESLYRLFRKKAPAALRR